MANQINVQLNEKREAEYFSDRFFFAIQAAGQLFFWWHNPANGLFLGLGLGMLYNFVTSCSLYNRLRTQGNVLLFADEQGITHLALSTRGPVTIAWEDIHALDPRKPMGIPYLRLQLAAEKQGKGPAGSRKFVDIPMDLLTKPTPFLEGIAAFPRAQHLVHGPFTSAESTAQAA